MAVGMALTPAVRRDDDSRGLDAGPSLGMNRRPVTRLIGLYFESREHHSPSSFTSLRAVIGARPGRVVTRLASPGRLGGRQSVPSAAADSVLWGCYIGLRGDQICLHCISSLPELGSGVVRGNLGRRDRATRPADRLLDPRLDPPEGGPRLGDKRAT